MGYIAVTNTFVNGVGNVIDAAQVNANFNDIVLGLSNGSKDINVSAGSFASNVTITGNETLVGNFSMTGTDKTANFGTAVIGGHLKPKTTNLQDLGSDSLRWNDLYCKDATMTSVAIGGEPISTYQLAVAGKTFIKGDVGIGDVPNAYGAYRLSIQTEAASAGIIVNGQEDVSMLLVQDPQGRDFYIATDSNDDFIKLNSSATHMKMTTQNGAPISIEPTGVLNLTSWGGMIYLQGDMSSLEDITARRYNVGQDDPTGSNIKIDYGRLNLTSPVGVKLTGGNSCSMSIDDDRTAYFNGGNGAGLQLSNDSNIAIVRATGRALHVDAGNGIYLDSQINKCVGMGTVPNQYDAIRLTVAADVNTQSCVKIEGLEGYTMFEAADESGKSLSIVSDAGYIKLNSPSTSFKISTQNGADIIITPTGDLYLSQSGSLILDNIPTSDPSIQNAVWSDNGVLTLSEGGGG